MVLFKLCFYISSLIFFEDFVTSSPNDNDKNIIDGFITEIGQFPFVVSLQYINEIHFCGGSILDEFHVITAAHCSQYITNLSEWSIKIGTNNLTDFSYTRRGIRSVKSHEQFQIQQSTYKNDIAIIQLDRELIFSDLIKPIPLTKSQVEPGTTCTVIGWGAWEMGAPVQHDEQKAAYVTALTAHQCNRGWAWPHFNSKTMVCASNINGGNSTCQADSGGPLMCNDQLVGITSFGDPKCTARDYPNVFTNVVNYISWIESNGVKVH